LDNQQPTKKPIFLGNNAFIGLDKMQGKIVKILMYNVAIIQYRELRDVPYYGTYALGVASLPIFTD
jgi:hypothetical protein